MAERTTIKLLRKAWGSGAVLCGVSAGMLCWFEGGLTDSFGGLHPLEDGLGLHPYAAWLGWLHNRMLQQLEGVHEGRQKGHQVRPL